MAEILKIYTKEQLYELAKNKVISDGSGLTDFNSGSKIRSILESNSEIVAMVSFDFKEALYKAIPIALYQGFGFTQKEATSATGAIRPYRRPALWIKYTGAGTSALITSTSLVMNSAVTGAPGDAFSFDYATYSQTSDLVTAIDALANWEATLVQDLSCSTLYQYTDKEVIAATNYINTTGLDIMLATDVEISVPTGYSVTVNDLIILSTEDATIEAGESGVSIDAEVQQTGTDGNISANAVDTLNGDGYINSAIDGIEHAINDSAFSGGDTAESSTARKVRFQETVNSLNAGTKSGIIAAIKTISGIRSVGMRTNYPFKGTNTIVVDNGSGSLGADLIDEIETVLYGDPDDITNYPGKNAEGIGYNIVAPTIVPVDVGISATRLPAVTVDLTEIRTDIQTAVEQYINTRQLGENVLLSEIIRVGKNSNAAVYDLVVTSPASNVAIAEDEFAKTGGATGGTVTVTVTVSATT